MHTGWDASGTGMERYFVYMGLQSTTPAAKSCKTYLTLQVDKYIVEVPQFELATTVMLWPYMI
jgi:hypothetical protein